MTGAIEIRLTETTAEAYVQPLRTRFDFDVVPLELEDIEVAAGHVDRDVVDRQAADSAFEAVAVGVAIDVRDRTRESPFAKAYFTLLDELEIVPA